MNKKDKFLTNISSKFEVFEFQYFYNDIFVFLREENKCSRSMIGKIYIRIPTWADIYEIRRLSVRPDPYNRHKTIFDQKKWTKNKISILVWKLEDEDGECSRINDDIYDNIDPFLCFFISQKVDEIISKYYDAGLSEEESKKLATDCYNYYRAVEKYKRGDKNIRIPEPPAIVLIKKIAEVAHCSLDEAKLMPKRDIDSLLVSIEQEGICSEPSAIGLGKGK